MLLQWLNLINEMKMPRKKLRYRAAHETSHILILLCELEEWLLPIFKYHQINWLYILFLEYDRH